MRLAAYLHHDEPGVGLVSADGQSIQPVHGTPALRGQGVFGVIGAEEPARALQPVGAPLASSQLKLLAPMRPRRNIFCVGKNYRAHAQEFARSGFDSSAKAGADIPEHPILFSKVPQSVIGPGDAIVIPASVSTAIDYEAELAVIIGRGGKGIRAADAMRHVWGYTIINDVTARDWQSRHQQWLMGKSFDTFCPMGPWVVSADAMNGEDARVRCWVNDEPRQDASTRDLIFSIPSLIETLSAGITLEAGDVIATGTPLGVGIGFRPPKYLRPGDTVRVEIDGIGVLENPVR
jgi:2-keto-4-pentenoate hydratase/2-oxohepta-3-ene-1,7-dioic acid hydratase in catechol pathway